MALLVLAVLLGMATAHWNVTTTGVYKDSGNTSEVKTP